MSALLSPVSFLYGVIAGWWMRREPAYVSKVPVVCIGNFTVGGSGKTPFTAFVCDRLRQHGRNPAILTRGYGGNAPGPLFVDAAHDASTVGDEALLSAASTPTVVSWDRAAGARLIEVDPRGFDVIVMDDGFQNRSLAKSLSIVLVTSRRGLGNGQTMPGGPLRAPLAVQKQFADVVVIVDGTPAIERTRHDTLRASLDTLVGGPILDARVEPVGGRDLQGQRVVAYCGIAAPERFFATVDSLGAVVADRVAFPDHHPLIEPEAVDLLEKARAVGATLVTTEKDLARLAGVVGPRAALRAASVAVPIRIAMAGRDATRLDALLAQAVGLS